MTNLLRETEWTIEQHFMTLDDIIHIGNALEACTWAEFAEMADRDYDSGFGRAEVWLDLVIIFKDGSWLERQEYDGREGWQFKRAPHIPQNPEPLKSVFAEFNQ